MMNNNNPLWYKDGVIYQVHIKAFRDSNGDGIGDFKGLLQKLDYLDNLGVNIIWILPFYPSPLKDDGYDIADYFNVHPDYGTIDDVKEFLREAHRRGIKVITELVLNHTSDQHPWFRRARVSPPSSAERNYYVWSDTPEKYKDARIIFQDFEPSNWSWDPIAKAYYWHRFYSHQPDLNFENPVVHKMLLKTIDFWMDAGVDGMRLDAVPYLYEREGTNCENLPETHEYLKKLNAHIQFKYKNRMLLAEANQWPEDAVAYFGNGDECQMAFHFPLMPRLYMSVQMEDRHPIIDILEQTPDIPENCQWAMFLRNHDELTLEMVTDEERDYMYRFYAKEARARINLGIRRRLAPLVENNRRKIELLNILLFSFPGTPVIYYGDEIGMGDNFYLGDRNGVRTPMQWSSDRNAGFSEANPQKLFLPVIIDPEYHYEAINVEVQQRNASSLLWWMKRTIAVRKNYKAFGRGKIEFLSPSNPKVLAFLRKYNDEVILIVANLSRFSQVVELDLSHFAGYTPVELFSRNKFPMIKENHYMLTLNAYDYYWFALQKQDTKLRSGIQRIIPEFEINSELRRLFNEPELDFISETIIPQYIQFHGWMPDDYKIQNVILVDEIIFSVAKRYEALLIIRINYLDKEPETFLLPVYIAKGEDAKKILNENSNLVLVKLYAAGKEYILVEGVYNEEFRRNFLNSIASKRIIKGKNGVLSGSLVKGIRDIIIEGRNHGSNLIKVGRINIRFSYFDRINLTLYRKMEESVNPGVDILRNLTEKTSFKNLFPYCGTITYKQSGASIISLGVFTDFVSNQGDLWAYMVDSVIKFFDNMSILGGDKQKVFPVPGNLFSVSIPEDETSEFYNIVGKNYFEMMSLLGKRTAEMHLALNSLSAEPGFETEYFSMLYQRSIYQSFRNTSKNTLRFLNKHLADLSGPFLDEVREIISMGDKIFSFASPLLKNKIITKKIRIHGDFNLKNILFTGKDFLVINFGGAENVPYSERKLKRSALRDTASIIWSLSFAAYVALNRNKTTRPEEISLLEPFAKQWWLYMSGIFLNSYFENISGHELLPDKAGEREFLLKVYLTEKALNDISARVLSGSEYLYVPVKGFKNVIEL
jgi:maltose alpha-D-glucosyltransferase/alpha-amylase